MDWLKKWQWILISIGIFFCSLASQAAVEFSKKSIWVGKSKIIVEIADNIQKRELGLMNRTGLSPNTGMLFIHEKSGIQHYWMKNTFIDLSIGFFDKNKKLVQIEKLNASKSSMQIDVDRTESKTPVKYALEVPRGWFVENKIKLGDQLKFN